MSVKKACGALLLGLALMVAMPAATEAGHRHHRGCGHHGRVYSYQPRPYYHEYDRGYYAGRYYDDVDYDAPYVARHGSGRGYYDGDYDYDYRYRGYSRSRYYAPRYSSRRVGYHYHGRARCFRPDRPHVHFTLRLF